MFWHNWWRDKSGVVHKDSYSYLSYSLYSKTCARKERMPKLLNRRKCKQISFEQRIFGVSSDYWHKKLLSFLGKFNNKGKNFQFKGTPSFPICWLRAGQADRLLQIACGQGLALWLYQKYFELRVMGNFIFQRQLQHYLYPYDFFLTLWL